LPLLEELKRLQQQRLAREDAARALELQDPALIQPDRLPEAPGIPFNGQVNVSPAQLGAFIPRQTPGTTFSGTKHRFLGFDAPETFPETVGFVTDLAAELGKTGLHLIKRMTFGKLESEAEKTGPRFTTRQNPGGIPLRTPPQNLGAALARMVTFGGLDPIGANELGESLSTDKTTFENILGAVSVASLAAPVGLPSAAGMLKAKPPSASPVITTTRAVPIKETTKKLTDRALLGRTPEEIAAESASKGIVPTDSSIAAFNKTFELARRAADRAKGTIKERVRGAYFDVGETLTDKFARANAATTRVRRIWQEETGNEIPYALDAEAHLALLPGATGADVQRAIDVGIRYKDALGRGIDDIAVNDFLMWNHAKDVIKMKGADRQVGAISSIKQADDLLGKLKTELGPDRFSRVESAARVIAKHYEDLLKDEVVSGLVEPALAKQLRSQYPWYNPLSYIETELTTLATTGKGSGLSVRSNGLGRLSDIGSELSVELPLNLVPSATINRGLLVRQNDASKSLVNMLKLDPESAGLVRKVRTTEIVGQVEGKAVFGKVRGPKRGTIDYMENGKLVRHEVPEWATRMNQRMLTGPNGWETFFSTVNAPFRAVLTTYNPGFFAINHVFDMLTVATTRGVTPWQTGGALIKNFKALVKNDPELARFMREGLDISGFSGRSARDLANEVSRAGNLVIESQVGWKALAKHPLETVRRIGHATELAPRRAVIEQSLRKGVPIERAILAGRRSTVDFSRSGSAMGLINSMFLYSNAAVQGSILPIRAARDIPFAKFGLGGFAGLQVAAYAWNRQFPEYFDLPLRQRLGGFVVMLPSNEFDERGNKVPHAITVIPSLREFQALTAPINYLLGKLDEKDPASMEEFLKTVGAGVNPAGSIVGGGLPVPTTLGQTLTEIALNRDVYNSRPIVPVDLEGLLPGEQFDEFTSEAARRLGRILNISPKKLDYFAKTGIGFEILALSDAVLRSGEGEDVVVEMIVSQLQNIQDHASPEQIPILRTAFLKEFNQETVDKVLLREKTPDRGVMETLPSGITRRFFKDRGGQMYLSNNLKAQDDTGFSLSQTREAGRMISDTLSFFHDAQLEDDARLDDGLITHVVWKKGMQGRSDVYKALIVAASSAYPRAAQVFVDNERDGWAEWKRAVLTGVNTLSPGQERDELMVAAFRSIKPNMKPNGEEDWTDFFARRDEFIAGLSDPDKRTLQSQREKFQTQGEIDFERDMSRLYPYWNAGVTLNDDAERMGVSPTLWQSYRDSDDQSKLVLEIETPALTRLNSMLARVRQSIREQRPSIDVLLLKWGFAETPRTPEGVAQQDRLLAGV
tara:strand:+ start:5649 stop:9626 length:3978 start_codon:yes stop_codon:yes gene_type:complete